MSAPAVCAVCGAAPLRVTDGVLDRLTGERFALHRCDDCGFAVTRPVPGDLGRYYPRRYRRFVAGAAPLLRWLYRRRVDGWMRRLGRSGTALEVGAGTGWMLAALRERGWRAVGSERDVAAAAQARERGAPVFVGGIDAIRHEPVLDLVVMFHVLEHLADPMAALRELAQRVRPGGALVIGLPNLASWQARAAGTRWWHLDVPRHLAHFTPESVERALRASGYSVTGIDFRSVEHDPLAWIDLALERAGYEPGLLLKLLTRHPRASGPVASVSAVVLAAIGLPAALALAAASWAAGRGAVMEVWARRD